MRALALVVLIACSSKTNELAPETWGTDDYVKAGVPASDHVWSLDEHEAAAVALATLSTGHRERLPHQAGARSGAVFARMIERADITDVLPDPPTAFLFHMRRYEAANAMSKLYIVDAYQAVTAEYLALVNVILLETVELDRGTDRFLASFGADDPKREARLGGVRKMHQGWGGMLLGGVLILADRRVPEPARITFAKQLSPPLQALFSRVEPDTQKMIREQLGALHANASTALRPALPRVP